MARNNRKNTSSRSTGSRDNLPRFHKTRNRSADRSQLRLAVRDGVVFDGGYYDD